MKLSNRPIGLAKGETSDDEISLMRKLSMNHANIEGGTHQVAFVLKQAHNLPWLTRERNWRQQCNILKRLKIGKGRELQSRISLGLSCRF